MVVLTEGEEGSDIDPTVDAMEFDSAAFFFPPIFNSRGDVAAGVSGDNQMENNENYLEYGWFFSFFLIN